MDKIPWSEFINDGINDDTDFMPHFEKYVDEMLKYEKTHVKFNKYETFNLCAFPWLFNTTSKQNILYHESEILQDKEWDQALI